MTEIDMLTEYIDGKVEQLRQLSALNRDAIDLVRAEVYLVKLKAGIKTEPNNSEGGLIKAASDLLCVLDDYNEGVWNLSEDVNIAIRAVEHELSEIKMRGA